jgi:hypothetical protein
VLDDEATTAWLAPALRRYYSHLMPSVETRVSDRCTLMSFHEVCRRRERMRADGCAHGFVDFAIAGVGTEGGAHGSAYAYVWSADARGNVHKRIDGGVSSDDWATNYAGALRPRVANAGSLADLDLRR